MEWNNIFEKSNDTICYCCYPSILGTGFNVCLRLKYIVIVFDAIYERMCKITLLMISTFFYYALYHWIVCSFIYVLSCNMTGPLPFQLYHFFSYVSYWCSSHSLIRKTVSIKLEQYGLQIWVVFRQLRHIVFHSRTSLLIGIFISCYWFSKNIYLSLYL